MKLSEGLFELEIPPLHFSPRKVSKSTSKISFSAFVQCMSFGLWISLEKAGVQRSQCVPIKGYKGVKGEPGPLSLPHVKGEKGWYRPNYVRHWGVLATLKNALPDFVPNKYVNVTHAGRTGNAICQYTPYESSSLAHSKTGSWIHISWK